MSLVFPFDPNIERASTIPARLYNDPVYLELERERIFAHTWQLVGRAEQVREHGQFFTARDRERLDRRAARRRHAARLLQRLPPSRRSGRVTAAASGKTLQCKYHGWTYTLDGDAAARAGDGGRRALRPGRHAPRAGAGRDVGTARLREPRRQGAAARSTCSRTSRARVAPFRCERCATSCARSGRSPATGRSTSTTTSRAITSRSCIRGCTRSSTTTATASSRTATSRIQHAPLRPVHGGNARPAVRSVEDGRRRGGLRLALPEHDAQRLHRADADERRRSRSATTAAGWSSSGSPPTRRPTRRPTPTWTKLLAFSDEIQDEDIEICEIGAAQPALARLRPRPLLGDARERRAPFPLAAARVPDVTRDTRRRGDAGSPSGALARRRIRCRRRSGIDDRRRDSPLAGRGGATASQSLVCSSARGSSAARGRCSARTPSPSWRRRSPRSGGQYVFVRRALGPYAGFLVGWNDWLSSTASVAAMAIVEAEALGALLPRFASYRVLIAEIAIALTTFVLMRGLRESDRTQRATSLVKAVVLLALVGACLIWRVRGGVVEAPAHASAAPHAEARCSPHWRSRSRESSSRTTAGSAWGISPARCATRVARFPDR